METDINLQDSPIDVDRQPSRKNLGNPKIVKITLEGGMGKIRFVQESRE